MKTNAAIWGMITAAAIAWWGGFNEGRKYEPPSRPAVVGGKSGVAEQPPDLAAIAEKGSWAWEELDPGLDLAAEACGIDRTWWNPDDELLRERIFLIRAYPEGGPLEVEGSTYTPGGYRTDVDYGSADAPLPLRFFADTLPDAVTVTDTDGDTWLLPRGQIGDLQAAGTSSWGDDLDMKDLGGLNYSDVCPSVLVTLDDGKIVAVNGQPASSMEDVDRAFEEKYPGLWDYRLRVSALEPWFPGGYITVTKAEAARVQARLDEIDGTDDAVYFDDGMICPRCGAELIDTYRDGSDSPRRECTSRLCNWPDEPPIDYPADVTPTIYDDEPVVVWRDGQPCIVTAISAHGDRTIVPLAEWVRQVVREADHD